MSSRLSINLHIKHLVVKGMSRQQAEMMQSALTWELQLLLPQSSGFESAQNVSLDKIKIPAGAVINPRLTGQTIARHIHQGLQSKGQGTTDGGRVK